MSDFDCNFSMELKHPIDEETWDKLTDTEFDKAKRIFFITKSGKEVAFIKEDVLDKIKEEILKYKPVNPNAMCPFEFHRGARGMQLRVLEIINKYKESDV